MQAVILAAGKSTRTYPLTLTRPKPLLPLLGKSILQHTLDQLDGLVDEVLIVVNYKEEMIKEHIGDEYEGIRISYITQDEPKGTGHAVMQIRDLIRDRFILMYGDDVYFREDMDRCLEHQRAILCSVSQYPERFGQIVSEEGMLADIVEKPEEKVSDLVNTGFYVLDSEALNFEFKLSERGEYEATDLIISLEDVQVIEAEKGWYPISYPWDLLNAVEALLDDLENKVVGEVETGVTLKGPVFVGEGTVIKAGSYIEGPVYFGENCNIGPNCYIRAKSVFGDGSKVGNGCEIKNSIFFRGVHASHLSYVGDSVLGEEVNIGAGTVVANLRHDNANVGSMVNGEIVDSGRRKFGTIMGDGVHTGINTVIYPGRKIWPGVGTLPGDNIRKDRKDML